MLTNFYLETIARLARSTQKFSPKLSSLIASPLWLTPKRNKENWKVEVEQFNILTKHGNVRVYKHGQGAPVWLVHDWSGAASDYQDMITRFADNGISTVTFDLPGHGHTDINQVTLQMLIEIFDELSLVMSPPMHVIAHGASAYFLMNTHWFKEYQNKLTLISPCFTLIDTLRATADRHGISHSVLEGSFEYLFMREVAKPSSTRAQALLERFKGKLAIYCSKKKALTLSTTNNVQLFTNQLFNDSPKLDSISIMNALAEQPSYEPRFAKAS